MQNTIVSMPYTETNTSASNSSSIPPTISRVENENDPVIITYNVVCRALGTSPRPRLQDVLINASWNNGLCIVRDIDGDLHVLAFSAALLTAFGASANLVRRFVTTFNPTACITALDAIRPVAPATNTSFNNSHQNLSTAHAFVQHSSSTPYIPLFLDFSASASLTPDGVSAILAAALLLPAPVFIELDLRLCPRLSTLTLHQQEWQFFLDDCLSDQRRCNLQSARVVGLALDASPISRIHPSVLSRLSHLQWISLRSTHVRSLFRAAEIVQGLTALRAALFSGPCTDELTFETLRREPGLIPYNRHANHFVSAAHIPFSTRLAEMQKLVDHTPFFIAVVDDGERSIPSRDLFPCLTPVTLSHHYRNFILATATPAFIWLDGCAIDGNAVDIAQRYVYARFERCTLHMTDYASDSSISTSPVATCGSVTQMLRARELGLSSSRVGHVASQHSSAGLRGHRPRKRKRMAVWSAASSVPNVDAALVAAGFPALSRSTTLSHSETVMLALTAVASRRRVLGTSLSSEHLRRVEQAILDPNDLSSNPTTMDYDHNHHQAARATMTANNDFREGVFERSMSTMLMTRNGSPKINYFVQTNDQPRQFEFNPARPSQLVYGTALGYLVVMDDETGLVHGCCSVGGGLGHRRPGELIRQRNRLDDYGNQRWNAGAVNSHAGVGGLNDPSRERLAVFGLSWLNKHRDSFLSGTHEEGRIHLYNVDWMSDGTNGGCVLEAETFEKLTSIHVNADDQLFAVSGRSTNVGLFDMATGTRLETMVRCHTNSINVIKFANHNPNILLTSSFDRSVCKWDLRERRPGGARRAIFTARSSTDIMTACFSPDDERVLVSAIDNEVRQYSGSDGRLLHKFDIPQTGRSMNFTRSYYMNERDYIVSGSCSESVVRVYNARNGKCVTEVDVDERIVAPENRLCVQSLRGNPLRPYNFCALLVLPVQPRRQSLQQPLMATVDLRTRW